MRKKSARFGKTNGRFCFLKGFEVSFCGVQKKRGGGGGRRRLWKHTHINNNNNKNQSSEKERAWSLPKE